MEINSDAKICLENIRNFNFNPKKYSKKITQENFKTEYNEFRKNLNAFKLNISSFNKTPANTMKRDEFFLSCMYTVCSHNSNKISFYKRAHQMKIIILSYVQGVKFTGWDKYFKNYNDNYTLEKNGKNKKYLKTVAQYLRAATKYFVSLCKCLGDENSAKKLEYSLRANIASGQIDKSNVATGRGLETDLFLKSIPIIFGEGPFKTIRDAGANTKTGKLLAIIVDPKKTTNPIGTSEKMYNALLNVKRAYRKNNKELYDKVIGKLLKCEDENCIIRWVEKYKNVERDTEPKIKNDNSLESAKTTTNLQVEEHKTVERSTKSKKSKNSKDDSSLKLSSVKSKINKFRQSFSRRTGFKNDKTPKVSN